MEFEFLGEVSAEAEKPVDIKPTTAGLEFEFLDEAPEQPSGTSFGEEVSQLGSAFVESIGRPLENMGESFDAIGFTGVANALKDVISEPEGYVSASQRFMEPKPDEAQFMGFAWQYAPRAAVEQVGQAIGAMGTRAVGAAAGGAVAGPPGAVAGGFAGPAIFGAAQVIGPVAKERAMNNGREVPNNEDLVAATLTAIGSGSLDAIGAKYLPGGEKATGKFFKRVASSFVGEGLLTEAPQSVIEQVGATAGTEKGLNINVKQAVGEGLIGGTSAAGLSAVVYPLTKKEEPDPKKKVIRTPEQAEELDIDGKSNEEAISLMGEPADQAQNERITKLKEIEAVIANNETLMTGLEPNAPERTQLDLENKEARKEADKLKAEISKSVGLSLPITTAEQQQIELAKQIAAPAEAPAITPAESRVLKMAAAPVEITPQTPEETTAFNKASSNKVMARNPQLAVAAVRLANGQITAGEYADVIDKIDPFTIKGSESIPSSEKINQYIDEGKKGKVNAPIESGKEVEFRIDIPTYNRSTAAGDTVYAVTAHEPVPETSKRVGEPISYVGVAKVINPKMMTRSISGKGEAIDIATGAGKFPLATVKGNYEPITELPTDINDPNAWTEVSYNPIRSSYFVDVRSKNAVLGGDEAVMVGSRVFVKNPKMQARPTGIVGGVGAKDIKYMAAEIRVEEKAKPVPEEKRYTPEEAGNQSIDFFGGIAPDGLVIINDSVNPLFEYKAGFDPDTSEIIVNLAYIDKDQNIPDIISHELGHYIAGDKDYQAAFPEFWNAMTPEEKAEGDRIINQSYSKATGAVQIEERQVRAFMQLIEKSKARSKWRKLLDAIKRWINEKFGTKFQVTDRGALAVLAAAHKRFKSGEKIIREMQSGVLKIAAEPAPEKPAEEKPTEPAEPKERGTIARMAITAYKTTPKGILAKTTQIIKDSVFDGDSEVSDSATKRAWNLISSLVATNDKSVANAEAINQLTREAMTEVKAPEGATTEEAKTFEVVKQTVGMPKLRNELFNYAIKLKGQGDGRMLEFLLNNELNLAGNSIKTKEDIGRFLGALRGISSYIITATEAEQAGFFNIAAQQFFDTKNPTDEQVQQIKDIFNKVKEVKIDQEKELMTELEEVGKAAGVDLPAAVDKQLENTPGLDPMVVAMTAMQKLYGGTITTQYEPISKRAQGRFEGVKKIIQGGISNYRQKIVSKAATGLETGFWKTLSSTEQKPGPLGELDSAQNQALGNIVKKTLVDMKLQGAPPNTKMSIYEQVASILGEQPLSQDKIKMADEKIRSTIKDKRQAELDNATEDQKDAINLKYDEMTFAWDNAMSRSLDMPVSDTMLRRIILNELKEADTSIQDIAKLMEEEPVIGASRQDRYVESIIEKIIGSGRYLTRINEQGKPEADYANLKTYLSNLLENMVLARQQKNKAAKAVAKTKRDASGDPTKQAQAQIDKLAKIQADPTIFGEKRIDPVRNAVRDALSLQLNIGFTPEQSAKIKANWKGAFVADPNKKGIPTSFMLELQRLGVSESAANTLADIVWRQIEVNAISRQMDATTKAVEAGPIGGIVQAILDTPLANQQDPEWRKNVILDYLKNAGVKPSQAENIAKLFDVSLRKRFAKAQEEAAIKAAKSIKGGLTTNSKRALEKFLKAIRAQVLDPGKDVAKAFAEEMGWKGFTSEQIVKLNELDAIVNDNEKTDAEKAVAIEQIQQIIDKVSMPPQIKEMIASFYIGNALMRFPTFSVQALDPLAMTAVNTAIESIRNVTNPLQFIQTWANYGRAISNLFREAAFSYKNDVLRSGRMIDYLDNEDRKSKRLWNEAVNKWKRGDIRGAIKDGLFGYTAFTFRTLKALDDGAYSLLTSTTLPQYVEAALKNAKIPREKRRGVMRQVLHAREMDIEQMVSKGIPKNDAVIYANERMQASITKELSGLNIDAQEVINSAINDALARIGKTRFAEDILTGKTEEIKDLGTISAPFLRWYESVSKAVSGKGSESQKIFYRILLGFPLIPARIFNIAAGYTPLTIYRHALKSRYSLTYGTALQRRQRLAEQLAGTMVLLPLLALRSNSTDEEDEKEKGFGVYITGQGPSKMKDKTLHAKWNDRHDPFSLEFRMGGKTKFSIDAKAAGPLSVMIYLLGAMDDWETNRRLDGLKTSKDDWKEAQDKASILTSLYELAGYATLTTARRGPTTGVMQGLVDFRRFPDDPIAAIGADVSFSAMPAVPILGTGIAKNLSDFFSQPIDNTTKEGAILSNIPIVGPIAGKPALNSYGQRLGELRVSEKLKKSFGVPFTLVVSDNEEDNKLTSLTLKFGDGPTPLRREDVENELKSAISDDEWYLAAKTFGDRNRSYVLKNYNRYEKMKPAGFSKVMSALGKASKANAISAVKKARRNNP